MLGSVVMLTSLNKQPMLSLFIEKSLVKYIISTILILKIIYIQWEHYFPSFIINVLWVTRYKKNFKTTMVDICTNTNVIITKKYEKSAHKLRNLLKSVFKNLIMHNNRMNNNRSFHACSQHQISVTIVTPI